MRPLSNQPLVLYTAAHGGFAAESIPLGGGAAVFEHLVAEWRHTRPFDLKLITPDILGDLAPRGRDLVGFSERAYAAFSFAFERASTEEILKHDPATTIVLVNDISEGPDFALLTAHGFRIVTIFHVDVVAYVTEMYLHGWVAPETTVLWERRLRQLMPRLTRLIWAKQEASVHHSRALIVPSEGMREVLRRCYPACPSERVQVLPWGNWNEAQRDLGDATVQDLRTEFGVPSDAQVLLTLSRISPEKGQDLLLDTLLEWEAQTDFPSHPLWLFICGDAAFMQGQRYLEKLKSLAARFKKTRVVFPGYVTGIRKQAFFALADLFVFPSRHESYGLTLLEALAHGVPAVCLDHAGARSVMRPRLGTQEFGALVTASELSPAIARLLADDPLREQMGQAAREYAAGERFEARAAELARILMQ